MIPSRACPRRPIHTAPHMLPPRPILPRGELHQHRHGLDQIAMAPWNLHEAVTHPVFQREARSFRACILSHLSEGVPLLAEHLKRTTILTDLRLGGSEEKFTLAEIKKLSEGLAINRSLETLELSFNELGDAGVVVLANALKNHPKLRSLNLTNNHFGDEGAEALGVAFSKNTKVTHLFFDGGRITSKGVDAFVKALSNQTLQSISFGQNQLDIKALPSLKKLVAGRSALIKLDLKDNLFKQPKRVARELDAVKRNPELKILV